MPRSRVFSFADPDAYQEKVRASQAAILTLDRGEFRAALTQIDLDRIWMQWGFDNLPRIARTTIDPERAVLMFIADSEQASSQLGGGELRGDNIAVFGRGSTNIVRTEGGSRWASLSLTHADLAEAGEAIVGQAITCPSETYLVRRPPELLARLRTLHAQAVLLARSAPEMLAAPAVAKALEHALKLHSDVSTATVTEIATTHGFWELGRFSVEYRGLFGESPSTSLRRPILPVEDKKTA
jgi:AraC-like DNA-binding protein